MNKTMDSKLMKKEIHSKEKQLSGEYKEIYIKTKKRLYMDVQPSLERANALSDFIDMLLETATSGRAISDLFSNGYEAFYLEIISVLPVYSTEVKLRKNNNKKTRQIAGLISCTIIFVFSILWYLGYIGIWTKGISYHAGNLNRFNYTGFLDKNEYSIKINLSDLDSNSGIVLYDDGECSIIVDSVDFVGWENGGYRIHFLSHGTYTIRNAKLVSGIKHSMNEQRYFSRVMTITMRADYMDRTYESGIMGISGINYKDGDYFSMYIFANLNDESIPVNIPETNAGEVVLTVTNLCQNSWAKK